MSSDPSEPLIPVDNAVLSVEHDDPDVKGVKNSAEFEPGHVI
jgi:hypothetical protein